jgi:predicted Zn finger-like uncharacterized protein
MIVQCPYCATRYQLEEERFTAPNPMLKCSRCRHVFPAPGSKSATSAKAKKTPPPEDENLTLPFERDSWKDEDDEPPPRHKDEQEGFVLGTEEELTVAVAEDEGDADEQFAEPEHEIRLNNSPAPLEPDLTYADEDETEAAPALSRWQSPDRFIIRALICFWSLWSPRTACSRVRCMPVGLADRLLGPFPVIGSLAGVRLQARDVTWCA